MKLLISLLFVCCFFSCTHIDKKVQHSFYYWKTTFLADSNTTAFINKEYIDHFYIHYFDVAWSDYYDMPAPLAEISGFNNASFFTQKQFTPVVFIANSCFQHMQMNWCDSLALKVSNRINFISNKIQRSYYEKTSVPKNIQEDIDEIQIDCDWTAATKEKYFNFLRSLKKLFPGKKISVTIRLYPYKYPKLMGVPPVDKGLLMCYNISNIKDNENPNSVFSLASLKQYLNAKKYPLQLDIALPVFGWYAWFSNGRFKNIIYPNVADSSFENNAFQKNNNNTITLLTDTMLNNNYLREGDVLRIEYPDPVELEDAAKILYEKFPNAGRISFYHWDKDLVKKYDTTIHDIYNRY